MSYLVHYGIKGQQWGVRRYQNEDGTLTSEGKRRYSELNDENNTSKAEKTRKKIFTSLSKQRAAGEITSDEFNKRMSNVDNLSDENLNKYHKKDNISKGAAITTGAIAGTAATAAGILAVPGYAVFGPGITGGGFLLGMAGSTLLQTKVSDAKKSKAAKKGQEYYNGLEDYMLNHDPNKK